MALMLKNDDDDKLITEMCSARCGPAEKREAGGVDGTLGSTTNVQKVVGSSWSRFPNKTVSLVYRIKRIELQRVKKKEQYILDDEGMCQPAPASSFRCRWLTCVTLPRVTSRRLYPFRFICSSSSPRRRVRSRSLMFIFFCTLPESSAVCPLTVAELMGTLAVL
jgi:hypothetical protein